MYPYPLLFIDVSGDAAIVALANNDNVVQKAIPISPEIGSELLQVVEVLIKGAKLELSAIRRIAVVPKSSKYSALRAVVTAAEGLCIAMGCELVEVEGQDGDSLSGEFSSAIDKILEKSYQMTPVPVLTAKYTK